jgi:hypothetical protein
MPEAPAIGRSQALDDPAMLEAPHRGPALKVRGAPAIKSGSGSGRLESAACGAGDAA